MGGSLPDRRFGIFLKPMPPHRPQAQGKSQLTRGFLGVFAYSRRALGLVWTTSRPLSVVLGLLTVVAGALPAGVAYVGSLIADAVVAAIQAGGGQGSPGFTTHAVMLVIIEGLLVAALAGAQPGWSLCQ